ncbi:MAG: hypothetical protein ACYDCL_05190 [Myxococcales bacterium]
MTIPAAPPRTVFAQEALDFAQLFSIAFAQPLVSSKTKATYSVEISKPEGPSTGGGVQGTQHITLVPQGGGPPLVVGSANRPKMTADLRTFALVRENHERRSPGSPLALDAAAYGTLLDQLVKFCSAQGMTVNVADAGPGAPVRSAAAPGRVPWGLVVGIAVAVLAIGLGLGLFLGKTR